MALRRLAIDEGLDAYLDAQPVPEPIAARYREMARDQSAAMMTHPDLGRLLATLVTASGGRAVLEIGTFVGISAAWMAGALAPGGRIDTLEANPAHADRAEAWFAGIGVADRVTVHRGPAAETLPRLGTGAYDLCYVDADKAGYPAYLEEAVRLVRRGGLIVADNVLAGGRVGRPPDEDTEGTRGLRRFAAAAIADPRLATSILTVGDGVAVSAVR
jgi:predicted O-methyltransferase YrrM